MSEAIQLPLWGLQYDYVVLCPHLLYAAQIGDGGGITKRGKQIYYYCRDCWQKEKGKS